MEDLEKMILAKKEKGFGGFLNYMEAKYGGKQGEEDVEMEAEEEEDDEEKVNPKNLHSKRIRKQAKKSNESPLKRKKNK